MYMSRAMRKCVLCHMRTTKAQISLHSAFVVRCLDSVISLDSIAKISRLASFCDCSDLFVSGLVGNSRRHILSCRGSHCFQQYWERNVFLRNLICELKQLYHKLIVWCLYIRRKLRHNNSPNTEYHRLGIKPESTALLLIIGSTEHLL